MHAETILFGHYADQMLLHKQIEWGREIFAEAGVRSNDSCLAFTLRVDGRRPINYNLWWVFQPFPDGSLGFLVDDETADRIEAASSMTMSARSSYAHDVGTWVVLEGADPSQFPAYIRQSAVETLSTLVKRGYHGSPQARFNSAVYKSYFFGEEHAYPALLLSWNPTEFAWINLEQESLEASEGVLIPHQWRTSNRKDVFVGMRCFLIKQGQEPRGVMASGVVTRLPVESGDIKADGSFVHYVGVEFETLLDAEAEELLSRSVLLEAPETQSVHWDTQASGILIPHQAAVALEELWHDHLIDIGHTTVQNKWKTPIEIQRGERRYSEGEIRQMSINAYERSGSARRRAIEIHGTYCACCDMSFEAQYGEIGRGFIHIHHSTPLGTQMRRDVNPKTDLVPVCPNCHAMLHRRKEKPFTVEELRDVIQKHR